VVVVPGETSDRIQELHMLILHGLVEAVEATLYAADRMVPKRTTVPGADA
jgi:D-sedoheptulose 7-phosphate isomerase